MHSPTISGMHTQGGSGSGSDRCPVLVEEFVPGMEITVGIAGNGARVRVIGSMEVAPVHRDHPFVYSLEVKRDFRRQVRYFVPPRLAQVLAKRSNVSPLPPIACSVAATLRGSTSGSMRMGSRDFSSAIPCRVCIRTAATSSSFPALLSPTKHSCKAFCARGCSVRGFRSHDARAHPPHTAAGAGSAGPRPG